MIDALAAGIAGLAAAAGLRADACDDGARWAPDSYDYAIRMLRVRGVPLAEAQARSRAFVKGASTAAGNPRFAHAFEGEPPWWQLFSPRIVYPALAAALYPARGFAALTDVAAAAHVASAVVLYRFLRRFGTPASALGLTLWYLRRPPVREVSARALTDSTAMLLWILTLDAMKQLADDGRGWTQFALCCAALSFTRPLPYLPLGGGVAVLVGAALERDGAKVRTGTGMTAYAVVCAAAVVGVLVRSGAPSTVEHLQRVREVQRLERNGGVFDRIVTLPGIADKPSHPLVRWYATALALSVVSTLKHAAFAVVPIVAVAGFTGKRRNDVTMLLGTLAGGLLGCAADPVPRGTQRTVAMPLYPVFAAGCMLAIERALRRYGVNCSPNTK